MPALTTREEARARLLKIAQTAIDRVVPASKDAPLRGATFADFENQSYEVGNVFLTALMEERAKLERNAEVGSAGRCPYCEAERTYLEDEGAGTKKELRSPSGPVLITIQGARCRACDGSFSPSIQSLAGVRRGRADTPGRSARGARSGHTDL